MTDTVKLYETLILNKSNAVVGSIRWRFDERGDVIFDNYELWDNRTNKSEDGK